ncbi:MAG: hypothetical protein R6V53_04865 [Candidatus Woesearchaeota archaeon]
MNEKIDWMLGMTENMLNITQARQDIPMVDELYNMAGSMKSNLEMLKERDMDGQYIDLMEQMMRAMEEVMIDMDMESDRQKMIMRHMMNYMIMMQANI